MTLRSATTLFLASSLFVQVCTAGFFATQASAQTRAAGNATSGKTSTARAGAAREEATAKRRAWLEKELAARVSSEEQVAQIRATLARLSHREIDQLAAMTLEQKSRDRSARTLSQAQAQLAQAQAVRDDLRRRLSAARAGGAPGFFPVITWLPSGASLTASAVVSPDRRYVRINAMPFFSQVGPVDTFNFFTGESGRLRQFDAPPSASPPESWYDGLRTRNGRRPGR